MITEGVRVPFTGSHPAAVLPLMRSGLAPSALVIGSMVPDLPYYLPLPISAPATHAPAGAVGVDILLGLVLLAGWHGLLAPFLVATAPARLSDLRSARSPRGGAPRRGSRSMAGAPAGWVGTVRRAVSAVAGLSIGAGTHIAWDSFTHPDQWGVIHVPWLAASHAGLPGYQWAQYLSGLAGMALIVAYLLGRYRRTPPRPPAADRPAVGRTFIVVTWAAIALAASADALVTVALLRGDAPARRTLFVTATHAAGAALAMALVCAAALLLRRVLHAGRH